jgi:hypothetical protein
VLARPLVAVSARRSRFRPICSRLLLDTALGAMPSFALSLASQIALLVQNLSVSNQNSVLYELSLVTAFCSLLGLGMHVTGRLAEGLTDALGKLKILLEN